MRKANVCCKMPNSEKVKKNPFNACENRSRSCIDCVCEPELPDKTNICYEIGSREHKNGKQNHSVNTTVTIQTNMNCPRSDQIRVAS